MQAILRADGVRDARGEFANRQLDREACVAVRAGSAVIHGVGTPRPSTARSAAPTATSQEAQ
jgi:hypothetical protein